MGIPFPAAQVAPKMKTNLICISIIIDLLHHFKNINVKHVVHL